MYGIRYLRVFDYVSVSECATGPVRESKVYPERPQMEKTTNVFFFLSFSFVETAQTALVVRSRDLMYFGQIGLSVGLDHGNLKI